MVISDPIADLLTRIRNANMVHLPTVKMPHSHLKHEILVVLKREGYIEEVATTQSGIKKDLIVTLKYTQTKDKVINGLTRISKPGLRVYASVHEIPRVLGGLGIAILSTSQGIKTDREARNAKIGGEVLAYIW
ncbi:MAG: 30S ribosomal protein S8 [Acholeplasmatales bacterium]|jgi:small subunit ribosomal protein S8|nr:30S ribosomal protein S8 [Acholeplasmatales bacterium]